MRREKPTGQYYKYQIYIHVLCKLIMYIQGVKDPITPWYIYNFDCVEQAIVRTV